MKQTRLALREITGHLALTGKTVTAWYVLPEQHWAFRGEKQRTALLLAAGGTQAALAGSRLHWRVTSRPYPVRVWAERLDRNTPKPVGGKAAGSPWIDHLVAVQRHLQSTTLAEKEVYLGVEIGGRSLVASLLEAFGRGSGKSEMAKVMERVDRITKVVAGPGLEAAPASPKDIEWLLHRSVALGLPAPSSLSPVEQGDWEPGDLAAFTDGVTHETVPFGRCVKVTAQRGGRDVSRYVAILTLGRTDEIVAPHPAFDPWMSHADRLPFVVEWSSRVTVLTGEQARSAVGKRLLVGRDMEKHYAEHGIDVPLDVGRKTRRAREVDDEMSEGYEVVSTRVHGWHRLAVSATTEQECLDRARQVVDLYKPLRMTIEHPRGQEGLLREFTPGEPLSSDAHLRRMPVLAFAAAMPTVSASLGDRRGTYLGYTCGSSRRAVMFDPHFATEIREKSGVTPVIGGLGAGKALALDTPLPTPTGWTTMADVAVGDHLLGANGKPVAVVAATEVMHDRPCYEVVFSDGERIVADAEHQWMTRDHNGYKRMDKHRRAVDAQSARAMHGPGLCLCGCGQAVGVRAAHNSRAGQSRDFVTGHGRRRLAPRTTEAESVVTTEQIAKSLTFGPNGQRNHAVRLAGALDLPDADLALAPYTLGAWLGDGHSAHAALTCYDREIVDNIALTGQSIRSQPADDHVFSLLGAGKHLRALGVLGNKHIPAAYLRASVDQRRALLAGLLDTDGHATRNGGVEIGLTRKVLAYGVLELVRSLGYKPTIRTKRVKGRSEASSICYTVAFTTSDKVFALTRKLARQVTDERDVNHWRYVVAVRRVDSVPVRCVQVDNADHLYLAGEAMVPTHNSVLLGVIGYESAMRGISTTLLDPSGPLARMTTLPEFKGKARHVDLLRSESGTLNPYAVVREPLRDAYLDDEAWTAARKLAGQERTALATDVVRMLLPPQVDAMPQTRLVIADAIRALGGKPTGSLYSVIDMLDRADDPHGKVVGNYLRDMAEMPLARLFYGSGYTVDRSRDEVLTVLTMPGLVLPPRGVPREAWSSAEALAVPLLHLAAYETSAAIYGRSMSERKLIGLDEAHFLGDWGSGRALFVRLARDSRKWNACVMPTSQNAADLLGLDMANFVSTAFVGRTEDEEHARQALRLLRVPEGVGYEATLGSLSPQARRSTGRSGSREFVMRDVDGNVEKMRVDLSWNPALLAALDSTAAPSGAVRDVA